MKVKTTKAMSSPGRAEKYYHPTALVRFLGSNSRGRTASSRSSPMMFIHWRRSGGNADSSSLDAQQEPTSPKVTCMGQVRAKRNARPGSTRRRHRPRCTWVQSSAAACRCEKMRPCCCVMRRPAWPRWRGGFLFLFSCSEKRRAEEEDEEAEVSSRTQQVVEAKSEGFEEEQDVEECRRARVSDVDFPRCVSPPKNALLLTRCRSAPYRSSSLACRFWGSPLDEHNGREVSATKQQEIIKNQEEEEEEEAASSTTSPTSKRASSSKEEQEEASFTTSPTLKRTSSSKEEASSSSTTTSSKRASSSKEEEEESLVKSVNETQGPVAVEVVEEPRTEALWPVILTRCKSEPTGTRVEKLDQRLGFT